MAGVTWRPLRLARSLDRYIVGNILSRGLSLFPFDFGPDNAPSDPNYIERGQLELERDSTKRRRFN